jgi:zinc transport system ATP-binding protein
VPLIECQNAAFGYEGYTAVRELNFSVGAGDCLCVVGVNGSGKSTLIKGLLHLKAPIEGAILYGGGLKPNQIGYLPQQTAAQKDFPASVYEVVLSGRLSTLGWRPFYSRQDRAAAEQNMQVLGIAQLRNKCFRELSGGQRQKVLLARALCATKRMLLLDEPTTGLDPMAAAELYQTIARLNKESGVTVIMVSHDIKSAINYADHILHLDNKQVFYGTAEEYKRSKAGEHYLGMAETVSDD